MGDILRMESPEIEFPKALQIRSKIMAMMLNGTLDWETGCAVRSLNDEKLLELLEEAWDKDNND